MHDHYGRWQFEIPRSVETPELLIWEGCEQATCDRLSEHLRKHFEKSWEGKELADEGIAKAPIMKVVQVSLSDRR